MLLGDAAHTAHFSIGSGHEARDGGRAGAGGLPARERPDGGSTARSRRTRPSADPVVLSTQRAAQASLEWFENLGQYTHQEPMQFAFNIMTRSRRVTYDNLRLRDPEFVAPRRRTGSPTTSAGAELAPGRRATADVPAVPARRARADQPGRGVSRWTCTVAVDGMPNDFHLAHLGGKALGGAGLVMTEMVCVSPTGRITPGCTGLWTDEQA